MQLHGIHHLTAVTAHAAANCRFYTQVLGMRLVKKTVNQDDVSAYHLFYADGVGSPGSDLTFFDWPAPSETRGTSSVVRTALRVAAASFDWWRERFDSLKVSHTGVQNRDNRLTIDFEDSEGQRLSLIEDSEHGVANPWQKSPVPEEFQIRGLGPISLSVPRYEKTDRVLQGLMQMRLARTYLHTNETRTHVYEMGDGGPSAELHVADESYLSPARQGAGGVHHVAFRISMVDYAAWTERLAEFHVAASGPVDRFYFRSLYFREPSGILFELATDEPGFTADEPLEDLGEKLSLPPFLEHRRCEIEAGLKEI